MEYKIGEVYRYQDNEIIEIFRITKLENGNPRGIVYHYELIYTNDSEPSDMCYFHTESQYYVKSKLEKIYNSPLGKVIYG